MRQREHIGTLWLEPRDRGLKNLQQPLVEQRNAGGRLRSCGRAASHGHEQEVHGLSGDAQRSQSFSAIAVRHGVRHVVDSLRRLTDRNSRGHRVGQRVDGDEVIVVLEPDIDPRSIARRPHAVRQPTDRNGGDLGKIISAEHLDLVEAAHAHVGERPPGVAGEVDVVGDRSGVDRSQHREGRTGIEHHYLADVFQREPDLRAVRRRGNVGTERAGLGGPSDDPVIGHGDHHGLRGERGADVAVRSVGREDLHAGAVRHDDARLLFICLAVEDGDVALAADGHPDFFAVPCEERLVRSAPDVGGVLHRVGRGIDEGDRVRSDRDDGEGTGIG